MAGYRGKMKKFITILFLVFPQLALAQAPMLAYDVSPNDYQCTAGVLRTCYLPAVNVWGPVNPYVGGPSVTHAYLTFVLANTQTVEITFDTTYFLAAGGAYTPGIGIDGYDAAHLCNQYQGGTTNDNPSTNISNATRANCVISLPAGSHTVYAMENARANSYPFRGAPNQALIIRFW